MARLKNEIDAETENWPVPLDLRTDLDNIKNAYQAIPMPVFVKDKFVELADVEETITGALVEIHFEFRHYHIKSKEQDSFNATVQQILVLQPGTIRPSTPYKRKSVREGPIRSRPSPASENIVNVSSYLQAVDQ